MSEIRVTVSHPAPVRHRPPRSRAVRRSYAAIATPVALVPADPAAFEPLPLGPVAGAVFWRRDLHVHADALWRPVMAWHPLAEANRPIRPDDLLAFLRADPDPPPNLALALPKAFGGTPLLARHWDPYGVKDGTERGEPASSAHADEAGVERARAALRAFLANHLRIAGDRVFLRVTPLAVAIRQTDPPYHWGLDPADGFVLRVGQPIPVRADRGGDALDAVGAKFRLPLPGPETLPPSALIGDGDIAGLACQAPILLERVGKSLASFRRSPRIGLPVDPEAAQAIEEMADLAHLGRIGAIAPGEVEPALLAVARAARLIDGLNGGPDLRPGEATAPSMTVPGLRTLASHIRARVLPRLDTVCPEDDDAVGLLAP